MSAVIAAVAFQLWQVVMLILLCCASLIVSLYCLIFMVPVKRFWERIESLGGGMKGIESHVDGVADEFSRKTEDVERKAEQLVEENVGALQKAMRERTITLQSRIREASLHAQEAAKELPEIRQSLESLRNALQEQSTHNSQFSKSVDSLAERLEQMQRDFGSLDVELRESVRQLVSDSHQRVEGTVLSALDAIQNQIIRGVERPPGKPPVERFAPRQDATSESPHRQDPRKIISAGPLFTPSENAEDQAEEQDEPAAPTEEEPEEEGNADEGQQEQPQ